MARQRSDSGKSEVFEGRDYTMRVEVHTAEYDDNSYEIVTDWYFTSPDGKKVARITRQWRATDSFCVWTFQFRPHPTHPRTRENRHGLQIDNWISGAAGCGAHRLPSNATESGLWSQAHKTAIEWVTKKRILRGGLAGWEECGWREGMLLHASVVPAEAVR